MLQQQFCTDPIAHFKGKVSENIEFHCNELGALYTPKNDDFLRLKREELWIRKYQSIEFGAQQTFLNLSLYYLLIAVFFK